MPYVKTIWTDDVTPVSAEKMNNIEGEVKNSSDKLAAIFATQAEVSTGTSPVKAVTPSTLKGLATGTAIASDILRASLDSVSTTNITTYVKKKAFTILLSGTYRVKFSLNLTTTSGDTCQGLIYKNGVAFGTDRSTSSSTYAIFSQDLVFAAGDTCELWIKTSYAGSPGNAKDFRMYFDETWVINFDVTAEIPTGSYNVV